MDHIVEKRNPSKKKKKKDFQNGISFSKRLRRFFFFLYGILNERGWFVATNPSNEPVKKGGHDSERGKQPDKTRRHTCPD